MFLKVPPSLKSCQQIKHGCLLVPVVSPISPLPVFNVDFSSIIEAIVVPFLSAMKRQFLKSFVSPEEVTLSLSLCLFEGVDPRGDPSEAQVQRHRWLRLHL